MPVVSQEAMAMAASGAHPNVVRYYSAWTERQAEGQYFYILMEKCEVSLGTKHLLDGQPFREDELLDILRQVWTSAECGHDIKASTGSASNLLQGPLLWQPLWQDCASDIKQVTPIDSAYALLDQQAAPWRDAATEKMVHVDVCPGGAVRKT